MRKKFLLLVLTSLMVVAFALPAHAGVPVVNLNGQVLTFDVAPTIINNGVVMVPMRAIFEALGAQVAWDDATKTITATSGSNTIKLAISGEASVNGEAFQWSVPTELVNGEILVPLVFVSDAMGVKVDWDDATQTVTITSASVAPTTPAAPATTTTTPAAPATTTTTPAAPATTTVTTPSTTVAATPATNSIENFLSSVPSLFNYQKAFEVSCTYQLNITDGADKGLYWIKIDDGKCTVGDGAVSDPEVTINAGEQLWLDIASNKVNGKDAYMAKEFTASGKLYYLGDMTTYFNYNNSTDPNFTATQS
jgi:putative sterol carrier protein